MLDFRQMRAIGMQAARQARASVTEQTAANDVIDLYPLLTPWKEGPYAAGDVVVYENYPYRVVQAHDSTGNAGWNPKDAPALFAAYHATDRAHALPYVAPSGAHDAYMMDEWMIWTDGRFYRCRQDATVWGPDVLPGAWEVG